MIDYAVLFTGITLLVTIAGWIVTGRMQAATQTKLSELQHRLEINRDAHQVTISIQMRHLDEIESWLREAVPMSSLLIVNPLTQEALTKAHDWQVRVFHPDERDE